MSREQREAVIQHARDIFTSGQLSQWQERAGPTSGRFDLEQIGTVNGVPVGVDVNSGRIFIIRPGTERILPQIRELVDPTARANLERQARSSPTIRATRQVDRGMPVSPSLPPVRQPPVQIAREQPLPAQQRQQIPTPAHPSPQASSTPAEDARGVGQRFGGTPQTFPAPVSAPSQRQASALPDRSTTAQERGLNNEPEPVARTQGTVTLTNAAGIVGGPFAAIGAAIWASETMEGNRLGRAMNAFIEGVRLGLRSLGSENIQRTAVQALPELQDVAGRALIPPWSYIYYAGVAEGIREAAYENFTMPYHLIESVVSIMSMLDDERLVGAMRQAGMALVKENVITLDRIANENNEFSQSFLYGKFMAPFVIEVLLSIATGGVAGVARTGNRLRRAAQTIAGLIRPQLQHQGLVPQLGRWLDNWALEVQGGVNLSAGGVGTLDQAAAALWRRLREISPSRSAGRLLYNQLENTGWTPQGNSRAIWPDRNRYPTVEIRPNGDILGSYRDVRRYVTEAGLTGRRRVGETTVEVHHLLEDRLMDQYGITQAEGRCVSLEADDHAIFSAEVPRHLPRRQFFDIDEIYEAHARVYRDHNRPEWIQEMRQFLRETRERIKGRYEQGRVPGAHEPDFVERTQRVLAFLDSL